MADAGTSLGPRYTASPDYAASVEDSRRHHATSKTFSGSLVNSYRDTIATLARAVGATSMLDYGCGKGAQYEDGSFEEKLGFKAAKYDPAVPGFDRPELVAEGKVYDFVLLSHVLFWIPLADLRAWVLPKIYRHARKAVIVIETIGDPKKRFLRAEHLHPRGLHAIDWIDLLVPFHNEARRPETHLCTEYRALDGRIRAGWWRL